MLIRSIALLVLVAAFAEVNNGFAQTTGDSSSGDDNVMEPIVELPAARETKRGPDPDLAASLPADLNEIVIPADATSLEYPFRPFGNLVRKVVYFSLVPEPTDGSDNRNKAGHGQATISNDGDRVGERVFYDNGQIAEEKVFRFGTLCGVWRQFYPSGQVFSERPYRNGVPDGVFRYFSEDGKLLGQSAVTNGNGILHEFKNLTFGTEDAYIPFKDGNIDGELITETSCSSEGQSSAGADSARCRSIVTYREGQMEGWTLTYGPDGKLFESLFMHNGRPHGVYRLNDRRTGKPAPGYPKYFVNGNEVTHNQFQRLAEKDAILSASMRGPNSGT